MGDRSQWTVVLRCYICKENFTLRHLGLDRVFTVPLMTPCPHCFTNLHSSEPRAGEPRRVHSIDELRPEGLETIYRKAAGDFIWHFSESCSRWPRMDFVQIEMRPQRGDLCGECSAKELRIKTH
jgi:hypothetical protein